MTMTIQNSLCIPMEKIDTIRGYVHFPVAGIENISYISSCINGYFLINPEITFIVRILLMFKSYEVNYQHFEIYF